MSDEAGKRVGGSDRVLLNIYSLGTEYSIFRPKAPAGSCDLANESES